MRWSVPAVPPAPSLPARQRSGLRRGAPLRGAGVTMKAGDPVLLTLIKDADHRQSRDEDIARLLGAVEALA